MSIETRPVRVVVEPGSHHMLNLGDVAMLQVAVARVRELWPGASVEVIAADPEALARHVPNVRALPAAGRYDLVDGDGPRGRLGRGGRVHLHTLAEADLLLVTGRGGTTDAFLEESLELLDEVEAALDQGVPVAMVGQGFGPMRDERLVARATTVLPRASLVAVRERRLAVPLLEALGVPADRVAVTGDDAVEAAWSARPAAPAESGIGLSLRVATYAGVGADAVAAVGRVVRAAADSHGSGVVPLPISLYPSEEEAGTLARIAGVDAPEPVESVLGAIALAGRCRAVVAGSYHAAVFALAQGVPAIGLASSPYYASKLEGLREEVGGRMAVVRAGGRLFEERLRAAIDTAWETPAADRATLVEIAGRQVEAGRAAYARLAELVRPPAGASVTPP